MKILKLLLNKSTIIFLIIVGAVFYFYSSQSGVTAKYNGADIQQEISDQFSN